MKILKDLLPENVFWFFEEITAVPRGSGVHGKIQAYCENFARERNLRYISDNAGNVIIFKEASAGCENSEPVIIQGHLDMVWEKDETSNINFETDGLELAVDGDFIHAKGTTLGGDDGIAVAMCLALLDADDIKHPALEIVFTTDEETGMNGARALDVTPLKSKRMINLDSEAEGTLWVSCAGGARVNITLPVNFESNTKTAYKLTVSGLHGGHSGAEIHKGYANANKVMGRVLAEIKKSLDISIVSINGGTMDNAITRDSASVLACDNSEIYNIVSEINSKISVECIADPDIKISICECDDCNKSMTSDSTARVIDLLNALPYGVMAMSKEIDGLVETSLNLGILKTENNNVSFSFSVRSSVDGERKKLSEGLKKIADGFGCNTEIYGEYPAWEYKPESVLRDKMSEIYKEMFNKNMVITAIHAGLECGLFCGKIQGLDCVSLGPDMLDIHTPQERLSISSTERTWRFLLRVLEDLC